MWEKKDTAKDAILEYLTATSIDTSQATHHALTHIMQIVARASHACLIASHALMELLASNACHNTYLRIVNAC